jgi:hypothetical protein
VHVLLVSSKLDPLHRPIRTWKPSSGDHPNSWEALQLALGFCAGVTLRFWCWREPGLWV